MVEVYKTIKITSTKVGGMHMNFRNISGKLLLGVFLVTLILSSTIGFTAYHIAKKELIESGKLDIQHITEASLVTLQQLNEQVENDELTLPEAEELARTILLGPEVDPTNTGMVHDISNSKFIYKNDSYLFAFDSDLENKLSPFLPFEPGDDNYEESLNVNTQLEKVAKNSNTEDRFTDYLWQDPGQRPKEKIAYMTYFEPWDWNIGIGAYTHEFYESLHTLKWIIITVSVLGLLGGLILFYVMSRKQVRLLQNLTISSESIAAGNLQIDSLAESEDEIGQLGHSFNIMTKNLQNLINHLRTTSTKVVNSAQALSDISEQTHINHQNSSFEIQMIGEGSVKQAEEIEQLSKHIEKVNQSIDSVNNHSTKINHIMSDSKQATENGIKTIAVLKQANDTAIHAANNIHSDMTNLFEKINDITSITETIKTISEQTNLLALNASIEASRAGEHGKGFAVVAEEVRKLAEASNRATLEIDDMIAEISNETAQTMSAMNESVTASENLNENVIQVETSFNQIDEAVHATASSIEYLTKEVEQVSTESESILAAVQNVSAIAEETMASISEIASSIEQQLAATDQSRELARNLSEISNKLDQYIREYK